REFAARPKQFASKFANGINEEEAKAGIGAVGNYMN
ncbi:MAG: hypothetical protein JWP08_2283, partial [Bryobacterales bacterium]|nr:hypothetical protein [Bryobacterales bacterium]